jgi:hypothetical protein
MAAVGAAVQVADVVCYIQLYLNASIEPASGVSDMLAVAIGYGAFLLAVIGQPCLVRCSHPSQYPILCQAIPKMTSMMVMKASPIAFVGPIMAAKRIWVGGVVDC